MANLILPDTSTDPENPDQWGQQINANFQALDLAKAEKSALLAKASTSYVDNALTGKADLVNGKVPTSQIAGVTLSGRTVPVANQAARLALTSPAQVSAGDIAVQADNGIRYTLVQNGNPSLNSDWLALSDSAVSGVTSVNGQSTASVTLAAADVGAADATATALALAGKASTGSVSTVANAASAAASAAATAQTDVNALKPAAGDDVAVLGITSGVLAAPDLTVSRAFKTPPLTGTTTLTLPAAPSAASNKSVTWTLDVIEDINGNHTLNVPGLTGLLPAKDTTGGSVTQFVFQQRLGKTTASLTGHNLPGTSYVDRALALTIAPLAYWRMTEATGAFTDYSGNARALTVQGTGITRGGTSMITADPTSSRATLNAGSSIAITATASNDTITAASAHGLAPGDRVFFDSLTGGAGLAVNFVYTVLATASSTTFTVTRPSGVAVDITTDATAGTFRKAGLLTTSGSWITSAFGLGASWTIAAVLDGAAAATYEQVFASLGINDTANTTNKSLFRFGSDNATPFPQGKENWIGAAGASVTGDLRNGLTYFDGNKWLVVISRDASAGNLKTFGATGAQANPSAGGSQTVTVGTNTFTPDRFTIGASSTGGGVPAAPYIGDVGDVILDGAAWDISRADAYWDLLRGAA